MSKVAVVEVNSEGWKNWQIALAVGIPVAVVGAYLYKKYSDKSVTLEEVQVTECKKENAQLYKKRGNKHFIDGQYEKAIECYSKAIELGDEVNVKELSTFHQNRAAAQEHMKNYLHVIADCSAALELDPKYLKALSRRAKAYRKTGFLKESLDDVTYICVMENFENTSTIELADELIKDLSKRMATEKLKQNRNSVDPGITHVWAVLNSFSQDPVFKYEKFNHGNKEMIIQQEATGPFETAVKEIYANNFKNVIDLCTQELNDKNSEHGLEALLLRGTWNFLMVRFDKASEDFNAILRSENADKKFVVNVLIKEAKIMTHKNNVTEAINLFNKAEEIDPENPDIFMHRGQLLLITDKLSGAIKEFEKAISLNDKLPAPHIYKCFAEARQLEENPKGADNVIQSFEALLEKFPECPDAYTFYGQALMDLQMFEKAHEFFTKAIKMDPNNPLPYVHDGVFLLTRNEVSEAMESMKKAIEVDEKSSFALQALGSLEIQRGDMESALKYINKAIEQSSVENELTHLYSLLLSAELQTKLTQKHA